MLFRIIGYILKKVKRPTISMFLYLIGWVGLLAQLCFAILSLGKCHERARSRIPLMHSNSNPCSLRTLLLGRNNRRILYISQKSDHVSLIGELNSSLAS